MPKLPPYLRELLPNLPIGPDALARLHLRLAQTLTDDAAWVQTAETLLPTDAAVARQLLSIYTNQGARAALLRTATAAFNTWPDQFGGYVLGAFKPAIAPLPRCATAPWPTDYDALRPLLNKGEITTFV